LSSCAEGSFNAGQYGDLGAVETVVDALEDNVFCQIASMVTKLLDSMPIGIARLALVAGVYYLIILRLARTRANTVGQEP